MFEQLNINIFNVINQFAGNNFVLDKLMISFAEASPYVFILFLIYLWFQRLEDKNIVLYATYSATLGIIINFIIALFYFHPRPFMDGIGTNLVKHVSESSFPSDHTTFIFSIALLLLYYQSRKKSERILLVLAIVAGVARVYTGVHYPFDIFGAFFVALFSSFIVFSLKEKMQKINNFFIDIYFKVIKYFKLENLK